MCSSLSLREFIKVFNPSSWYCTFRLCYSQPLFGNLSMDINCNHFDYDCICCIIFVLFVFCDNSYEDFSCWRPSVMSLTLKRRNLVKYHHWEFLMHSFMFLKVCKSMQFYWTKLIIIVWPYAWTNAPKYTLQLCRCSSMKLPAKG